MLRFWILSIVAFTLPVAAAKTEQCSNLTDQTTMNNCAATEFLSSDEHLNSTYTQIISRLQGQENIKQSLKVSQLAWIKFRDAECIFSTSQVEGGSAHPMLLSMCKSRLTIDRIKQLTAYLRCEEGDISCNTVQLNHFPECRTAAFRRLAYHCRALDGANPNTVQLNHFPECRTAAFRRLAYHCRALDGAN